MFLLYIAFTCGGLAFGRSGLLGAETIRVRIAWGGGAERLWEGDVSLSGEGTLTEPRPLGIEADEPGSMWLEAGRLVIRQRSPRTYDGVDLLVTASPDARLLIRLTASDDANRGSPIEIPLKGLLGEFCDNKLDDHENRLLVRRSPGDLLRVSFDRDALVFSPGEVFNLNLEPHLLPVKAGSKVRLGVELLAARSEQVLWSAEHNIHAVAPVSIPLQLNLPSEEGVYDVVITATHNAGWPQAVRKPLNWKKTIAERRVQLLVLDPRPPISARQPPGEPGKVVEIDPANPRWWELLGKLPQIPKVPRLWKGPLGNGNMKTLRHPLGELVRLNPNRESPDVSWEAYSLPVGQSGAPHIVEVNVPSDVSQTIGISVLEPNAAGALMPIGLDSGIDTPEQVIGGPAPHWVRHRLIFWPRTAAPMLLISNLRDRSAAVYGKIRILSGWEHLPAAFAEDRAGHDERLLAAYLDRPLFPENFSAVESYDSWSGRSLDDWRTFYDGGSRLVEYLQHVGYNGLMLTVAADGSTIYPSAQLHPTPRYDMGVFFATAADPVRKDVLEMLLRMFDRRGLQLIPTIEFASPLPALEAIRHRGGPQSEAIQWIGPDGKTWCQVHPTRRALAPYYNVLNPLVQEAMLQAVRELVGRYSHHPSFTALAIQLSVDGYAQLPTAEWGMDDATVARFEQDTGLKVPAAGPDRFAQRAEFLTRRHRRLWLEWRAGHLSRFYRRVHAELTALRPGGRLYLAGTGVLAGAELENQLRPTLPRRTTIADLLLEVGIDARHYQDTPGLVLLRPRRITASGRLNGRAVDLVIGQTPDFDQYFQSVSVPGSLFFHQPSEVRIESFDEKSPFKPAYTWLVAQPVPSGRQNRHRFVHELATLDSQVMVDGGWLLPLGQEESLQEMIAAYRRLPAVQFRRVTEQPGAEKSQPVTFRWGTCEGHVYVYAVNDSPVRATAEVRVDAPPGCRLEELTGRRQVAPLQRDASGTYWRIELQPYDLAAARFSHSNVTLSRPRATLPESLEADLRQRITQLGVRTASLRAGLPPLKVLENPGFEQAAGDNGELPGWRAAQRLGVAVEADATQMHGGGRASARLSSDGPVASLVSRPFEPPNSGRLSLSVWLRVRDANRQPQLRLAVQGNKYGHWSYYRAAPVGRSVAGQGGVSAIGTDWQRYVFPVDDLPLEGLTRLQVRFDLMGAGEVWIDEVELFDLRFSDNEVKELSKLVTLIHVTLENGQTGDCIRLLEGYWPQFLEENVALPAGTMIAEQLGVPPIAPHPPSASVPGAKPAEPATPRTGFLQRVRDMLPNPF